MTVYMITKCVILKSLLLSNTIFTINIGKVYHINIGKVDVDVLTHLHQWLNHKLLNLSEILNILDGTVFHCTALSFRLFSFNFSFLSDYSDLF